MPPWAGVVGAEEPHDAIRMAASSVARVPARGIRGVMVGDCATLSAGRRKPTRSDARNVRFLTVPLVGLESAGA